MRDIIKLVSTILLLAPFTPHQVLSISVPITFPGSSLQNNQNHSPNRRVANLYNRPNSAFNRLTVNNDNIQNDDNDDEEVESQSDKPVPTQQSPATGNSQTQNDNGYFSNYYFGNRYPRRGHHKRRRRPCIPFNYNGYFKNLDGNEAGQGRTFWDLNVFYADVDVDAPVNNNYPQQQSNFPQRPPFYNPYGGYPCYPAVGSQGGIFGSHFGNQQNNGQGGGLLGFFGPGGLFDFSNSGNGGTSRPPVQGAAGDSPASDTVKPVIEINVQDTLQDAVSGNWNAGQLVGGIASAVQGFVQTLASRPQQTVQQVNREIYSYLRPIYRLF